MTNPIPDRIEIPEFIPTFKEVWWLNASKDDYKLLKNTPDIPASYSLPDASTTVKWWVKLVTAPASPTNPLAVWDNDPRLTKYYKSWIATLASGSSQVQIVVGFHPEYVRITASSGSNNASFYTSWNKTGSSNWIWFDFQSWLWTTSYTSTYAVENRRNSQRTACSINITTDRFLLDFDYNQITTEIMWEAFA